LNVGSGVVFGTGDVTGYSQNQTQFASTNLGGGGNAYLAGLAGIDSFDALTLEFDFVPNADWVSFDYVFGSEEHPTFSCDPFFNDIFAITVEGVSVPLAETLITLLPGTTTPVSIGTINNQGCGNPAYFVDNAAMNGQYVAFGGFTTVLTAEMAVICGETYHLRMMISDGGDGTFDSGCFVAENSLTTGNVTIETASLGGDTAAIEGCGDLEITLTLNGDPIAQDYPVSIWLSGGSTAAWGVDYDPITALNLADSTIVIPAGSSSVSFLISAVNDNIPEGIETIDLRQHRYVQALHRRPRPIAGFNVQRHYNLRRKCCWFGHGFIRWWRFYLHVGPRHWCCQPNYAYSNGYNHLYGNRYRRLRLCSSPRFYCSNC
jgi:hypothetical protein